MSTTKIVLFHHGSTELRWCENCVFFLPVNILTGVARRLLGPHDTLPCVLIGCKSHLNSRYEIFPSGYTVICKDRSLGGGGCVFLCFRKTLPVIEQPSLLLDAEAVWAKLMLPKMSPIYISGVGWMDEVVRFDISIESSLPQDSVAHSVYLYLKGI